MTIGNLIAYLKKFDPDCDSIGFITVDKGKRLSYAPVDVHPITGEDAPFFLVEIDTDDPIPLGNAENSGEGET